MPGEKEKILALKQWNPEYFDQNSKYWKRSKGYPESFENGPDRIVGRCKLDFKVPWLWPGDKIVVRYPFQPEYPEKQRRNSQ